MNNNHSLYINSVIFQLIEKKVDMSCNPINSYQDFSYYTQDLQEMAMHRKRAPPIPTAFRAIKTCYGETIFQWRFSDQQIENIMHILTDIGKRRRLGSDSRLMPFSQREIKVLQQWLENSSEKNNLAVKIIGDIFCSFVFRCVFKNKMFTPLSRYSCRQVKKEIQSKLIVKLSNGHYQDEDRLSDENCCCFCQILAKSKSVEDAVNKLENTPVFKKNIEEVISGLEWRVKKIQQQEKWIHEIGVNLNSENLNSRFEELFSRLNRKSNLKRIQSFAPFKIFASLVSRLEIFSRSLKHYKQLAQLFILLLEGKIISTWSQKTQNEVCNMICATVERLIEDASEPQTRILAANLMFVYLTNVHVLDKNIFRDILQINYLLLNDIYKESRNYSEHRDVLCLLSMRLIYICLSRDLFYRAENEGYISIEFKEGFSRLVLNIWTEFRQLVQSQRYETEKFSSLNIEWEDWLSLNVLTLWQTKQLIPCYVLWEHLQSLIQENLISETMEISLHILDNDLVFIKKNMRLIPYLLSRLFQSLEQGDFPGGNMQDSINNYLQYLEAIITVKNALSSQDICVFDLGLTELEGYLEAKEVVQELKRRARKLQVIN